MKIRGILRRALGHILANTILLVIVVPSCILLVWFIALEMKVSFWRSLYLAGLIVGATLVCSISVWYAMSCVEWLERKGNQLLGKEPEYEHSEGMAIKKYRVNRP